MAVSEVPVSERPMGDDGEFTGFPAFDRPIRFVVVRAENVARFNKVALGCNRIERSVVR
jgi:hypothetical protein